MSVHLYPCIVYKADRLFQEFPLPPESWGCCLLLSGMEILSHLLILSPEHLFQLYSWAPDLSPCARAQSCCVLFRLYPVMLLITVVCVFCHFSTVLLSGGMNSGEGLSSSLGPQDISSFSHCLSTSKPLQLIRFC